MLPSVVRYRPNGTVDVGQAALLSQARDPRNTIVSVKRFMGRGLKDVAHVETMPYDFLVQDGMVRLRTAQGVKSPVEISAEILKTLGRRAEASLGGSDRGGHHRPGLLRRGPAPGHQGRGPAGRPERPAPPQRTHRGGHRLRPGQRCGRGLRRL